MTSNYKIKHINKIDYHINTFKNISELIVDINTKPINEYFTGDLESRIASKSFTQTNNINEALKLIEDGWMDGYKKIDEINKTKNFKHVDQVTNKQDYKIRMVGCVPHVPNYLAGIPTNMIAIERLHIKNKIVDIYTNVGATCNFGADEMYNKNIIVFNYIEQLELRGYRTNIWCLGVSVNYNECFIAKIKIKDSTDSVSKFKCVFPLAHPSMARRFIFALKEIAKFNTDWSNGYGRTDDTPFFEYAKQEMRNEKYIYFPSLNAINPNDPVKYITDVINYNESKFKSNLEEFKW